MTNRKDLGKRPGFFSKILDRVAGQSPPDIQEAINSSGHATISSFSTEYDNTPLSGDRVVNGKHCRTVGEYKAACAKFYGPQ
jgi:hypothetical protein